VNKKRYIAMKLYNEVNITLPEGITFKFPEGCVGAMLMFTSKKAARAFCGKGVGLTEAKEADGE